MADAPDRRAADADVRAQALDPAGSFIVQAPAGSGKTELLIQRLLVLLATVEQPEQVLAITFTRKAAAEMRTRLLEALADAEAPPDDDGPESDLRRATRERARAVLERDRARGWSLTELPGRLRILTIDALCSALVRERPLHAGLGESPRPTESPEAHYRAAARALLGDLEQGGGAADAMARLLLHLDGNYGRVEALLCAMLARRDQWLRHVGSADDPARLRTALEADWREAVSEALAETRAALLARAAKVNLDLEAELIEVGAHAARFAPLRDPDTPLARLAEGPGVPPAAPDALPQWEALAALLTTKDGNWRRSLNRNNGFPTDKDAGDPAALKAMKARAQALIDTLAGDPALAGRVSAAAALPAPAYAEAQWAVIDALLVLLPRAVEHLEAVFAEAGEFDYVEIALAAVRTLEQAPAPGAMETAVRHVLVDEFQDTSHGQFRLLECLTAGWPADGSHTLFGVGDPMQSIYRFREAEVGLFLRAQKTGVGAIRPESLRLEVNFRSGAPLVDWVNAVFPEVLPAREDAATGAVPFAPAQAHHGAEPGAGVFVHPLLQAADETREALDAREAALVTRLCAQVRAERPDERIAILVRTRALLRAILPALQAAGLPAQAVEIESLAERQEVRDVLMLARALTHPGDRVAWLAVLRAPGCGLTLADLLHVAGDDARSTLWARLTDPAVTAGLPADGQARVARAVAALGPCMAGRERRSLRRTVEGAWLALGGPACVPQGAWPNVEACLTRLETLTPSAGPGSPETFAEMLERLFAVPDPAADERLQVMTVHKAKGLQFDTVILPGLGHSPRGDETPLLRWFERPLPAPGGTGLLLAPIPPPRPEPDAMFDFLGEVDKARDAHETGRLLYVAATRARRALHVVGHARLADGAPAQPAERTLLGRLWPAVAGDFQAAVAAANNGADTDATAPEPDAVPAAPPPTLRRLPADWQPPAPPPGVTPAAAAPSPAEPGEPPEFRWAGDTARHVGTVVHRLLRLLAREDGGGPAEPPPPDLPLNAAAIDAALAALGVARSDRGDAAARVEAAVRATLADERGRWVLHGHPQARSEYDLTTMAEGRPARSVIDRTFVADGVRWIVDFKTGTHAGGSVEGFLDAEVERYRDQLERYADLLRRLEPDRPVRLALYFPLLQAWREWPAPEEA